MLRKNSNNKLVNVLLSLILKLELELILISTWSYKSYMLNIFINSLTVLLFQLTQ